MKQTMSNGWVRNAWSAALAALVCASQASWGLENPPMPPPTPPETQRFDQRPAPEPLFQIPEALVDPSFERYVDLASLGKAYLDRDARLMTDVGLQILEGERVLLRSHSKLKANTVLELAVRIATNQGDMTTLDRLEKAAARIGDKSLEEQIKLSRQLAGKSRAEQPPAPPPNDNLSPEQLLALESQFFRFSRATATGNLADLKSLQSDLKKRDNKDSAVHSYLEKQVAEAVVNNSESGSGNDEMAMLLQQLTGPSRGSTTTGPFLETDASGNIRQDARAYYLDSARPGQIYIYRSDKPAGGGWNEWVPQASYYGLIGRYGQVKIATGEWIYGKNANGELAIWIRTFENGYNPDWVDIWYKNATTQQWYGGTTIGLKDAMTLTFDDDNSGSRLCTILQGAGASIKPAAIVAASKGALKLSNSSTASVAIAALPGPTTAEANRAMQNNKSGSTIIAASSGNIVAAGGGNAVLVIANIVAAGGGNIVAAGGGNIVAAGGGNLISKGGAGFGNRVVLATGPQDRLNRAKVFTAK